MQRRRRPGIGGRIRGLLAKADNTLDTAQGAILAVQAVALGFIDNLRDGVNIRLRKSREVRLRDFFFGDATELPVYFQVEFPDEDDDETVSETPRA